MTQDELKLVFDALNQCNTYAFAGGFGLRTTAHRDALAILEKAIAELKSQEPVGVIYKSRSAVGGVIHDENKVNDGDLVYTRPPQRTEQEPLAYINVEKRRLEFAEPMVWHTPTVVNLERIPLYTQQRTWAGLTDEEIGDEYVRFEVSRGGFNRFEYAVKAIEAKLALKNGYAEEKNNA
jgi:hypothetical protein